MKKYLALFVSLLMLLSITAYGELSDTFVEDCKAISNRKDLQDGATSTYEALGLNKMDDETLLVLVAMANAEFYKRGINNYPRCNEAMTPIYTYVQENLCKMPSTDDESKSQDSGSQLADDFVRPEIKAAIDSYVDYFRSYADFMKSYSDGSNMDFNKYLEFLSGYADMLSKFHAIEDTPDLTDAETLYYLNASIEVEKLLLGAIQ